MTSGFNTDLLRILVCPLTRTRLDYDPAAQELVSRAAQLAFPIRNGIPVMLTEEARRLSAETDGGADVAD